MMITIIIAILSMIIAKHFKNVQKVAVAVSRILHMGPYISKVLVITIWCLKFKFHLFKSVFDDLEK